MSKITAYSIIYLFIAQAVVYASSREVITKALTEEFDRTRERLALPGQERPFFTAYNLIDVEFERIHGIRGALLQPFYRHQRKLKVRLMVGSYRDNNEHLAGDWSYRQTMLDHLDSVPLEDDCMGIRRALWAATDNAYKEALEQYGKKQAIIRSRPGATFEQRPADFTRTPPVKATLPALVPGFDRDHWQDTVRQLSAMFGKYPLIDLAHVELSYYRGDHFVADSEGSLIVQPVSIAALEVSAFANSRDGLPLWDSIGFYVRKPGDLPGRGTLELAIKELVGRIQVQREAPSLERNYYGPILVHGAAVVDLVDGSLFAERDGLLASPVPLFVSDWAAEYYKNRYGNELEERMNLRIMPVGTTVEAMPGLDDYLGLPLIGSYRYDEEGVPAEQVVLVEDGRLKSLLNDRSPTPNIFKSNGHRRPVISSCLDCENTASVVAPSVIRMRPDQGEDDKALKSKLIQLAKADGLSSALIVRKLAPRLDRMPDNLSIRPDRDQTTKWLGGQTAQASLVSVEDGSERLLGPVVLAKPTVAMFRRIAGMSKKTIAGNYFHPTEDDRGGVPVSYLVPEAILFDDMVATKVARERLPQAPLTSSPYRVKP